MAENLVKDQLYFFFDQTRCMGCQTCVVACKDWQELKPGRAKLRNLQQRHLRERLQQGGAQEERHLRAPRPAFGVRREQ